MSKAICDADVVAAIVRAMRELHRWATLDDAVKAGAAERLGVTPVEFEALLTDDVVLGVMVA